MIQVENLTKKFPGATAVDGLTFSIQQNEIVGFLGPNGAGKTTTMRILTAFMRPSQGRARVAGFDVETQPLEARRVVGYLPENSPLYSEMRVTELLQYRARLKSVPGRRVRARVDEVIGLCGVGDVRHRIVGQLSKGFHQRVALAEALVHDPPILILDEPTVGLDPNQIRQVRSLINELGRQRTILLSSHILPEVEQVCGRIVIINQGRIVAQGHPDALRKSLEGAASLQVEMRFPGVAADPGREQEARDALAALEGVTGSEFEAIGGGLRARLSLGRGLDLREEIFRLAVARGWTLLELSQRTMTLEDVFVNLTTREAAPDDGPGAARPAGEPSDAPDGAAP